MRCEITDPAGHPVMIKRHGAGGDLDDRSSTRNQTQEESHRIRGEDRPRRQGIASGKASIVTDETDKFTERGFLLKSGEELAADIIITATGFNMSVLGDIVFAIEDKPVDFSDTVTYRGMMFTGVPNML